MEAGLELWRQRVWRNVWPVPRVPRVKMLLDGPLVLRQDHFPNAAGVKALSQYAQNRPCTPGNSGIL